MIGAIQQLDEEELYAYMVSNWATLVCCFTNLQKTSIVKFKAASFSCTDDEKHIIE